MCVLRISNQYEYIECLLVPDSLLWLVQRKHSMQPAALSTISKVIRTESPFEAELF